MEQGRHRDMVHFAEYIYKVPLATEGPLPPYHMPGRKNGKWEYLCLEGRTLDKARFDEWKTRYYAREGWDTRTGWPTRSALETLAMGKVADGLQQKGKLGEGEKWTGKGT